MKGTDGYTCYISDCLVPVDRLYDGAYCAGCDRTFCFDHMLKDDVHDCNSCPEEEYNDRLREVFRSELSQFLDSAPVQALANRASALRGGVKCSVPTDRDELLAALEYGGRNWLVPIDFEDGQRWLARLHRQDGKTPNPSMRRHALLSEIATYEYLASIGVPVPKVLDYSVDADGSHGVGQPYMLLERLDGCSLTPQPFGYFSDEERAKILPQLARIQIKLAEHPLPAIGSLHIPGTGSPVVGPFSLDHFGAEVGFGPFGSARDYWSARIGRRMEAILQKKAYSRHTLEAYLAVLFLRERVQVLYPKDYDDDSCFYFRHMDDKGDHIIADEQFNFLGMVDLEYSWVLPKAEAFTAPACLVDHERRYSPELSPTEKEYATILRDLGREDLASCAERGRPYRLIHELFITDLTRDLFRDRAEKLLLISDGVAKTWAEWREQALIDYADDQNLKILLN